MTGEYLKVERGQFLFDLEGREGGLCHSRKPHVPDDNSGVTIGRGYDLKSKTEQEVREHFRKAGISDDLASKFVKCIGFAGNDARKKIKDLGLKGQEVITKEQQKKLFVILYAEHEAKVKKRIGEASFNELNQNQQEALISLHYNAETLIGDKLVEHIQKKDWSAAVSEIRLRSNAKKDPVLQIRRENEANLFLGLKEGADTMGTQNADDVIKEINNLSEKIKAGQADFKAVNDRLKDIADRLEGQEIFFKDYVQRREIKEALSEFNQMVKDEMGGRFGKLFDREDFKSAKEEYQNASQGNEKPKEIEEKRKAAFAKFSEIQDIKNSFNNIQKVCEVTQAVGAVAALLGEHELGGKINAVAVSVSAVLGFIADPIGGALNLANSLLGLKGAFGSAQPSQTEVIITEINKLLQFYTKVIMNELDVRFTGIEASLAKILFKLDVIFFNSYDFVASDLTEAMMKLEQYFLAKQISSKADFLKAALTAVDRAVAKWKISYGKLEKEQWEKQSWPDKASKIEQVESALLDALKLLNFIAEVYLLVYSLILQNQPELRPIMADRIDLYTKQANWLKSKLLDTHVSKIDFFEPQYPNKPAYVCMPVSVEQRIRAKVDGLIIPAAGNNYARPGAVLKRDEVDSLYGGETVVVGIAVVIGVEWPVIAAVSKESLTEYHFIAFAHSARVNLGDAFFKGIAQLNAKLMKQHNFKDASSLYENLYSYFDITNPNDRKVIYLENALLKFGGNNDCHDMPLKGMIASYPPPRFVENENKLLSRLSESFNRTYADKIAALPEKVRQEYREHFFPAMDKAIANWDKVKQEQILAIEKEKVVEHASTDDPYKGKQECFADQHISGACGLSDSQIQSIQTEQPWYMQAVNFAVTLLLIKMSYQQSREGYYITGGLLGMMMLSTVPRLVFRSKENVVTVTGVDAQHNTVDSVMFSTYPRLLPAKSLLSTEETSASVTEASNQSDIFYDCIDEPTHFDDYSSTMGSDVVPYSVGRASMDDFFDHGQWDANFSRHPDTGEPVFTYRLYRDNVEVGSTQFYKHPLLCRSEDGTRHNIIATTGILSDFDMDARSIEEVCAALPPTMFDKMMTSATQSAEHGVIRGVSKVVGYTLRSQQVSEKIASGIQEFVYYGGYFLLRYHQHSSQSPNATWQEALQAVYKAAFDTGSILLTNVVVNQLCQGAQRLSHEATQHEWPKLGRALRFFGDHGSYGVYAMTAVQQDLPSAAASFFAGSVTQRTVEQVGCSMVNRFAHKR